MTHGHLVRRRLTDSVIQLTSPIFSDGLQMVQFGMILHELMFAGALGIGIAPLFGGYWKECMLLHPWEFPDKNPGVGAVSSFRGSSLSRDQTHVSCISCISKWILYYWVTWEWHQWKSCKEINQKSFSLNKNKAQLYEPRSQFAYLFVWSILSFKKLFWVQMV